MDVGEVNNSIWLAYESSKLLHVIMRLLPFKIIYWLAITAKMKRRKDKLCELCLEFGRKGKEEETEMTGEISPIENSSSAV